MDGKQEVVDGPANMQEAIEWTRASNITHFLAVGGGSAMDTAKAANLYNTYKKADLFDFINAPIGKGLPITKKLSPLIASESRVRGQAR